MTTTTDNETHEVTSYDVDHGDDIPVTIRIYVERRDGWYYAMPMGTRFASLEAAIEAAEDFASR